MDSPSEVGQSTAPVHASNGGLRIGILLSHPAQYLTPVFQQLDQCSGIELTVIYKNRAGASIYHDPDFNQHVKWDVPLLAGYDYRFLSELVTPLNFPRNLYKAIFRKPFDVVIIHGYNDWPLIVGILISRLNGARILMRGDTPRDMPHHRKGVIRKFLKRTIFLLCHGFLAIGLRNSEYYKSLGAKPTQIYFAPLSIDNERFSLPADLRAMARNTTRAKWKIPVAAKVILFVGKLSAVKRPIDLILAFEKISHVICDTWLVIIGSGALEVPARELARDLQLGRVVFAGFCNQAELPSVYAAADVFVLPSDEEPWGLVVNEAMAAGLPVIVSDQVGCAPDLVQGHGNGIVYECGNIEALAAALTMIVSSESVRNKMGLNSADIIQNWSVAASATAIANSATHLMRQTDKRA